MAQQGKNLPAVQIGALGLILGSGRSPGGGHGNPLQYSCLENPHGQRSLAGYSPWGRTESDGATKHAGMQAQNACQTLSPQYVTGLGDGAFKEVIKVKGGHTEGLIQ